jgi:hypothetical protein
MVVIQLPSRARRPAPVTDREKPGSAGNRFRQQIIIAGAGETRAGSGIRTTMARSRSSSAIHCKGAGARSLVSSSDGAFLRVSEPLGPFVPPLRGPAAALVRHRVRCPRGGRLSRPQSDTAAGSCSGIGTC